MIWGPANVTAEELEAVQEHGPNLLGFNEPDIPSQANMSVEQALDLWPQLEATGLRLGSPATARDGSVAGSWLDRFMAAAEQYGYRVDFIQLHYYSPDFATDQAVANLEHYLNAVYERYGLPIWLTEYGLADFFSGPDVAQPTEAESAAFAAASTELLEQLPFVERYAWFSLTTWDHIPTLSLFNNDGEETEVGTAYRLGEVPPAT